MNPALKIILGVVLGAAAGFGWHRLAGCRTGTCPLSSNPYVSAAVGAAVGLSWALG